MTWAGPADRFQRRHAAVGFPLAVLYKLIDDRGPYLAALITYYAFVSLFPLLLLFTSATGFLLDGNPHLRDELMSDVFQSFPGLGTRLRSNIEGFHGSVGGVVVGLAGTLYGALGATQAAQTAFNQMYGVPRSRQPNPIRSRLRSLGLLVLLGTAVVVSTGIAVLVSTANGLSSQLDVGIRIVGYALTFSIDVALLSAAFQLLTARELRTRHVITGGITAAVAWGLVQTFGSIYLTHEAAHAGSLYGVFGLVLAAIAGVYVEVLALVVSAEINVVKHEKLWPRALLTPFTDRVELTDGDRRAYTMYARAQRFKGFQEIDVRFSPSASGVPHNGKPRSPARPADPAATATPGDPALRPGSSTVRPGDSRRSPAPAREGGIAEASAAGASPGRRGPRSGPPTGSP